MAKNGHSAKSIAVRIYLIALKSQIISIFSLRHVGRPKRHMLTHGWSKFVSAKKLVEGDTVIYLRFFFFHFPCIKVYIKTQDKTESLYIFYDSF